MTADAFPAGRLAFLVGFEDTHVEPPAGSAMGPLDEYALTDHDRQWRDDLRRVRDLGADAVRYGVQWPAVHTAPGRFDWSVLDERLPFAVQELGLTVVADLVHYGAPVRLARSFADPAYPDAVAEFAGAFAERYRGLVDHVTPLNEPVTTASFCGLRGVWPPALTGWTGWTEVVLGIVEGIRRTIAAVRSANPAAAIVHVEAAALYTASIPELEPAAALLRGTAALPTDLLLGRVDAGHPLRGWLQEHGAAAERLDGFLRDVPVLDLLGVNYYPDLTPRVLVETGGGVQQRTTDRWTEGLERSLRGFGERYGLPMLVTETSVEGDPERRRRWAADSAAAAMRLAEDGVDVRGWTWWPVVDFVDWSWASAGRNVEEFLIDAPGRNGDGAADQQRFADPADGRTAFLRRMGLFALDEGPDGSLVRIPTAAAEAFRAAARPAGLDASRAG